MEYLIVFAVTLLTCIMSGIAGGGAGLVISPMLLLLGFEPQIALASATGAGIGLSGGSLSKFTKHTDAVKWHWAKRLALLSVVASIIGTQIIFIADAETLRTLVGIIVVGIVPISLFAKNSGNKTVKVSKQRQRLGVLAYFLIMTVQAGLGSGIGTLLMFVFMGLFGFDALSANATKRAVALPLMFVSFLIFAFSGYMDWALFFTIGISSAIGGYIGAHIAVKKGNLLVKRALFGVSFLIGLNILFG